MSEKSPADGYFSVYEEHSKTLRTWFVAYGIGAPVFILNNPTVLTALKDARLLESTAVMFLVGVRLQVVLTALNKAVAWTLYAENDFPSPRDPPGAQGLAHGGIARPTGSVSASRLTFSSTLRPAASL